MLSRIVPRRLTSAGTVASTSRRGSNTAGSRTGHRIESLSGADWVFQRSDPMGGASGEAFTNPLESTGMHPAAVLAREAIQNAVDERIPEVEKVLVRFRMVGLLGESKQRFVETAQLSRIVERRERLSLPTLGWLDATQDPEVPLNLLFVEDFHTTGLEGEPHDSSSKFHRFLLSVGDGGKVYEGHNTGGSYGFGKAAFSSNSGLRTIFAYTCFRDSRGSAHTRLFGCGYFRSHRLGSDEYNGRAWFGLNRTPGRTERQLVDPIEDDHADVLAEQLGFKVRPRDQLGTSVLIVDTVLEPETIVKGVEEWWWPRLLDGKLDVEVISPDGTRHIPRPRARPDLQPFIDAYDIAVGKNPNPVPRRESQRSFRRFAGLELGVCGLKVLDLPAEGEDYPVPDDRVDAVALIRVPGMVVGYHRGWRPNTPALVGAFVASDQIDDILRLSEPPAHDKWDPASGRLRDMADNRREIVLAVLARISSAVREFRKSAAPPPPPRTRRLIALERELANFLVGRGPKESPVQHPTAPVHLTYARNPEAVPTNDGRLRARAEIMVRLKEDADIQTENLRLKIVCAVLEDNVEGDPIEYDLRSDTEYAPDPSDPDVYLFSVEQDSPVKFTIVTEPYDPLWTVRLRPDIEPVVAEAAG